jgi:hypothetical protein
MNLKKIFNKDTKVIDFNTFPKKSQWVTIEHKTRENAFTTLSIYSADAVQQSMTKEKIDIIKHVNMLNDYKFICAVSHKWSLLFVFRHQNWFQKLFNI